jgi:hypothetical protein
VPRQPDREPVAKPPLVDDQLADELLGRAQAEGVELLGPDGLLSQVTKAVLERALGEELTHHLGYEKHDPAGRGSGNSRNGATGKRLLTEVGGVELEVPRDRNGTFAPQIVRKGPDPAGRVQRPDHRLVRAWPVDPRHPGASAGDVRRRGVPGSDQPGHLPGCSRSCRNGRRGRWTGGCF